jgi:hypothetical protein
VDGRIGQKYIWTNVHISVMIHPNLRLIRKLFGNSNQSTPMEVFRRRQIALRRYWNLAKPYTCCSKPWEGRFEQYDNSRGKPNNTSGASGGGNAAAETNSLDRYEKRNPLDEAKPTAAGLRGRTIGFSRGHRPQLHGGTKRKLNETGHFFCHRSPCSSNF